MPDVLANKIAAGEVVQRPASVVKELVENSIDAGARLVRVFTRSAGRDLIQVVDDGCGMSETDAVACFRRHATSKIRSIEDLEQIQTLGFRGEALASISSVARVELRTRRREDTVGTLVKVEGGAGRPAEPCATPAGTSVSVRNLFYNVPARRNFLKTPATELRHIVDTVQSLALSNPATGFELRHDETALLRVDAVVGDDRVRRRTSDVFGADIGDHLVPVSETTSYLRISGFVGRPERHRKTPADQHLFVNGRMVRSRYLAHAVKSAYENMLPEAAYPFFVLFLDLDAQHIDVNVHPTKAEIKFDDERGVYGFVRAVVKKALGMADLIPQLDEGANLPGLMTGVYSALDAERDPSSSTAWPGQDWTTQSSYASGENTRPEWAEALYGGSDAEVKLERRPVEGELRYWQLADRYIATPLRSGLLVVDPVGAHQRIIYEHALEGMRSGRGLAQQLLFPETVEFASGDFELLLELLPHLRSMGFEVEEFGGRSLIVRAIPADVRQAAAEHLLREFVEEYRLGRDRGSLSREENIARSIARRGAVRAGARMSPTEMSSLVDQLFLCASPYTCPSGHPTMIRLSTEELARRFAR